MSGQGQQLSINVKLGFSIPTGVPADILAKPMGRFLMQGMTLTHGYLASPGVVPIDTGRLRSSLQPGSGTTGIDPSPVPRTTPGLARYPCVSVIPIDTGRLRSSLQPGSGTTGIDPSPVPLWFKVGTNVEYAAPLDSPETRDPHYRAGPSEGKPTKGWLSDSPKHVAASIEALYPRLAADIEAAFAGRG